LKSERVKEGEQVGHLPAKHNGANVTHRSGHGSWETHQIILTYGWNLNGECVLIVKNVRLSVVRNELLSGLVSKRDDNLEEVNEFDGPGLVGEVEIESIRLFLDRHGVGVSLMLQDKLFEPEESFLVCNLNISRDDINNHR
jgi:hypothetical protein